MKLKGEFAQTSRIISITAIVCLLFVSCLGIEIETTINADGSGVAETRTIISQMFFAMDDGSSELGVPMSMADVQKTYGNLPGVTVLDIDEENTEEDKILITSIGFEHISKLKGAGFFEGTKMEQRGRETHFTAVLKEAHDPEEGEDEMEEQDKEMMRPFFEGYAFSYTLNAPKTIISHSDGTLSEDKKSVHFTVDMFDYNLMKNSEPFVLEVVW